MIRFDGQPDFREIKKLEKLIQEKMLISSKSYALTHTNECLKLLISEVLNDKIESNKRAIKLYDEEIKNLQKEIDDKTKAIAIKSK